jgi:hypothetical protein
MAYGVSTRQDLVRMWQTPLISFDLFMPQLRIGDRMLGFKTITFSCLRVPDQKMQQKFSGAFVSVSLSVPEDVSVLKEGQ